ncbi:MAG: DUF4159 domain-containing protein, partial [Alphaproteobacteria bacterium]|nr:DUF4159 domain-containing protein [Alphaproteobacteria bacterium]
RRTTAALGEPMAVDLESDPLVFFPLVYWAVNATQEQPSEAARGRINDYLRNGGMILLDTAEAGEGELRRLTEGLAIPPLAAVDERHVLTRSFYLLRDMPGRYAGAPVWVERGDETINDGVSSVIVGGNGWAGAWAIDGEGRALLPVVPGGERQRELAVRFGVNLVMYALTGNYKADQVHVPAIMERLGQ